MHRLFAAAKAHLISFCVVFTTAIALLKKCVCIFCPDDCDDGLCTGNVWRPLKERCNRYGTAYGGFSSTSARPKTVTTTEVPADTTTFERKETTTTKASTTALSKTTKSQVTSRFFLQCIYIETLQKSSVERVQQRRVASESSSEKIPLKLSPAIRCEVLKMRLRRYPKECFPRCVDCISLKSKDFLSRGFDISDCAHKPKELCCGRTAYSMLYDDKVVTKCLGR